MFSHPSPQPTTRTAGTRTALVTGAARRIGRGIALALADAGFHVAITYNRSAEEAQETVRAIEARGVRGLALACDLGEVSAIRDAVAAAGKWAGACCPEQTGAQKGEANAEPGGRSGKEPGWEPHLDLLVNNAGAFETAALAEVTAEQWDSMFSTNTRAPMLVAQAALPLLKGSPRGGRIVNLGSLGGLHPWITHAHYCASKAALHMLTQTMAKAWAPQVAVNCIAPGMIVTGSDAGEGYAHFAEKTPMRRNGRVEDVAELVVFLASASMFLTGQVIAVDGGLGL